MTVYEQEMELRRFRNFVWHKNGAFGLRLTGVNLHRRKLGWTVNPVYTPTLAFFRVPGCLLIEAPYKNKAFCLLLRRRPPYISWETSAYDMQEVDFPTSDGGK